jgi:type VI secretion system protein ImpM
MASNAEAAPGYHGKLPTKGDFITRRLPRGFLDSWDSWLQDVIAGSRTRMGEAWLDAYLTSPIWRFALPAGLCGEAAAADVVMPSVDRVGRYFPLTIAAVIPAGVDLLVVPARPKNWRDRRLRTRSISMPSMRRSPLLAFRPPPIRGPRWHRS